MKMRIPSIAFSALLGASLIVSACSSSSPAASPTTAPTSAPTAAATTAPTTAPTAAATSPTAAAVATSAASPTSATPPAAATSPTTAAAATTAASPAAASTAASSATGVTVKVAQDPKLGSILTDSNGRTLYKFAKDQPNVSNCTGNCLGIWPPLTASGTPTLAEGVPGKLDVLVRPDGIHQVTYNGIPLYYYSKDTKPGDTNGQGVGGNWSVVAPSAAASANATAKSSN